MNAPLASVGAIRRQVIAPASVVPTVAHEPASSSATPACHGFTHDEPAKSPESFFRQLLST